MLQDKVDVSLAGGQKGLSGGSVSAELGREGRFKGKLLPASRRGRYGWHRRMAGGMCQKRVLHVLDWCRAKSSKDVLQQLVGGFMLTFHLVHAGFNGDDAVHVDWPVVDHIRG